MAESGFPKTAEEVVGTLVEIYRHQGQTDLVELLESATARIEETSCDNWNGGTYTYALLLDVPVRVFATLEPKLPDFEASIVPKLKIISRNFTNDHLDSVSITPPTSTSTIVGRRAKPAEVEVSHIWRDGFFRLFLSHVSAHKTAVTELKKELQGRGISAFVAHHITPSWEWQVEIELALRSMHALAPLLTPDFHGSDRTDQEVGFALGRGVLVLPVRIGCDPYGFIGKVQGLSGSFDQLPRVADQLATILLNHPSTHRSMRKGLTSAFAAADSSANAISLSEVISTVTDFAADEKAVIHRACEENDHVVTAPGVLSRVCSSLGVPAPSKVPE